MSDAELNRARSSIYQLLSSLFAREIDQQSRHELTCDQARDFWTRLGAEPAFDADVATIVSVLAGLDSDKALLELAADYCGLFLVGTKHSASPYASLYLNDTAAVAGDQPSLFGEQHQQMTQFIRQSQLRVTSEFPEPADHLAVILAYAGHLCLQGSDAEQLDFIRRHLANWLANFVARVEQADAGQDGHFYGALARLTLSWVMSDLQWLSAEVDA